MPFIIAPEWWGQSGHPRSSNPFVALGGERQKWHVASWALLLRFPAMEENGAVPTFFLSKSLDLLVSVKEFLHWPFRPGTLACQGILYSLPNFISMEVICSPQLLFTFWARFQSTWQNLWFMIHSLLFGILYICPYHHYGNKQLLFWVLNLFFMGFKGGTWN